ncbi:MAG: cytochrome P450 [Gammaproteobacteria bacterium]
MLPGMLIAVRDPETGRGMRDHHRFTWFLFSAGPRVCMGKQFSMLEGQLILAQVMRECRVHLDGGTPGFRAEGRLHPDRPVSMRLERR